MSYDMWIDKAFKTNLVYNIFLKIILTVRSEIVLERSYFEDVAQIF